MQHRFVAVLAAVLAAVAGESVAQGSPAEAGRDLAASCAGCHGTSGAIPILAGMGPRAIADRMHEFKADTRAGTVMPQLAKGYTEAEIALIAEWFGAQKAAK